MASEEEESEPDENTLSDVAPTHRDSLKRKMTSTKENTAIPPKGNTTRGGSLNRLTGKTPSRKFYGSRHSGSSLTRSKFGGKSPVSPDNSGSSRKESETTTGHTNEDSPIMTTLKEQYT